MEKLTGKKELIAEEMIFFIPRILFLTAVLFAVVILIKVFLIGVVDVREVESKILVNRLLYAKNGISYYDVDLNRVYPGIIDLKRFSELGSSNPNELDSKIINYGADNPLISAKVTLNQEGRGSLIVYYNRDRYDKWEPRVLASVKGGAGSVKAFSDKRYILVKDGENLAPAILEFNIIA